MSRHWAKKNSIFALIDYTLRRIDNESEMKWNVIRVMNVHANKIERERKLTSWYGIKNERSLEVMKEEIGAIDDIRLRLIECFSKRERNSIKSMMCWEICNWQADDLLHKYVRVYYTHKHLILQKNIVKKKSCDICYLIAHNFTYVLYSTVFI